MAGRLRLEHVRWCHQARRDRGAGTRDRGCRGLRPIGFDSPRQFGRRGRLGAVLVADRVFRRRSNPSSAAHLTW